LEKIIEIADELDRSLFLFLNGLGSPYLDFFMLWASDRFIWIPFYAVLVFLIIKKFKFQSIYLLVVVALLVLATDQITSGLLKPIFERFRPCHDPLLINQVHLVGRCGGRFGFASSHAANTFGVAMYLWLLFRSINSHAWLLFIWAAFVSYSRIYLGVHYPGDIIVGAFIGFILGYIMYFLAKWLIQCRRTALTIKI
jgi:undecaprenyl-diphosphatase